MCESLKPGEVWIEECPGQADHRWTVTKVGSKKATLVADFGYAQAKATVFIEGVIESPLWTRL